MIVHVFIFQCTDTLALNYDSLVMEDELVFIVILSNSMIISQNTPFYCDGLAILNPSAHIGPITYLWSTGSTLNNLTNLCAGIIFCHNRLLSSISVYSNWNIN